MHTLMYMCGGLGKAIEWPYGWYLGKGVSTNIYYFIKPLWVYVLKMRNPGPKTSKKILLLVY